MKTIASTTLSLILAATAFAEPPLVEIAARYEGFDLSRYAELADLHKKGRAVLPPRISVKSGHRGTIEIIRENKVPESPSGEKTVNSGVSLEVLPVVKDGQITLSAKSVFRRRLTQDSAQPPGARSFATQETFFTGTVENGKELTVAVGDGKMDKARIILTVQLVDATGALIR